MHFPEGLEDTPFTHIPFLPGKQWSDLSYTVCSIIAFWSKLKDGPSFLLKRILYVCIPLYFQLLKCLIFWLNTGLNIILISRTPYKLQNVAAEIEEKYSGVKTKIIEVDFAKEDSTSYIPKIEESIKAQ